MSDNSIEVHDLWKTFRIFQDRNTTLKQAILRRRKEAFEEFWALKDVSFDIPAGSSFGIIGANGAGKSTMLKTLARILVPDKGAVTVNGRVAALLELGAGFHPELSGRENIFLNGNILGMSNSMLRDRFDEIVEFSGLEGFIERPVKTYSSGMYARLGFSVAVAVEPDILLVDEVLAVGDEQFQRRCSEKMTQIQSSGRTVVFVSHSLSSVQQLCDHGVWLDKGAVKAVGKTSDVIDDYLGSVTTAFRLDDHGRQRTGSGEIQFEIELEHPGEQGTIETGAPLAVRMHWTSNERLENLAFGITFSSGDGQLIAGSSNPSTAPTPVLGPGSGVVEYKIPRLDLLPGNYQMAAAILDANSGHVYDHSPHIAKFDVVPTAGHESDDGYVTFGGTWSAKS